MHDDAVDRQKFEDSFNLGNLYSSLRPHQKLLLVTDRENYGCNESLGCENGTQLK